MKVAVFSAQRFEERFVNNSSDLLAQFKEVQLDYLEAKLGHDTAVLSAGYDAVCAFVNDDLSAPTLAILAEKGVKLVLLRCAGYNNVDLDAAKQHEISVLRVPAYSPHSVAEFAVSLLLTLSRKTHRAHSRVRNGNFSSQGLLGFEIHGKTVGVVGTGKIGRLFAKIMVGMGANVLCYDIHESDEIKAMGCSYVPLDELLQQSSVVSLHCPLLASTRHIINADALQKMQTGATLINVSRGELMDTKAVVGALKSGKLGGLGADVYEGEAGLFFQDLSGEVLQDDVMMTLQSLPNVVLTPHVAFLTDTALGNIWSTTLENAVEFEKGNIRNACV